MPTKNKIKSFTRREFIKSAGARAIVTGLGVSTLIPRRVHATSKKLKILQYDHGYRGILPEFSEWFKNTYAKHWGKTNDTEVTITNAPNVHAKAIADVSAKMGHDLVGIWGTPVGAFENHVIDLQDIWADCEQNYGRPLDMALKTSYNPKTKKYFAFCPSYSPQLNHYRKDLWDDVGVIPDSWENVRKGGHKIKKKHNLSVGICTANVADGNTALRAIMHSYGGSIQDDVGNLVINSKQTLDSLKFFKALYEDAMDIDIRYWNPYSNNQFMLSGMSSMTLNPITIIFQAEKYYPEIYEKIQLAKTPKGAVNRIGPASNNHYLIWKFAKNIDGAKKFLIDYVNNFQKIFLASKFLYLPCFPTSLPNFNELISNKPKVDPSTKYKALGDAHIWSTNVGYPGYMNPAIDEICGTGIIPEMFDRAATGEDKPEYVVKEAEEKCKYIYEIWKEKGLV